MALGQRVKIGVLLVVVVSVLLSNVAVVVGALDWMGHPQPNLAVFMAAMQLVGLGFAGVAAARRCDED